MGKEQRLQVKIDALQEKWQLLTFKLGKLEEERIQRGKRGQSVMMPRYHPETMKLNKVISWQSKI